MSQHIDSYYAASANPAPEYPPLTSDIDVDVCVIGGGIAGCSTALHLAERGYRVALVEGKRIGWGASGRSGGQAIWGYSTGQDKLVSLVGRADAKRLFDISIEALDLIESLVTRHAIRCDLHRGHMLVGIKPRHELELHELHEQLEFEYGYSSLRWMDRVDVEKVLATTRYRCALRDDRSAHLHPLNFTLGLATAAEAAGAVLIEDTEVVGIDTGATARVRTARGPSVRAKHVAICAGGYLDGRVSKRLRNRIMPVGTYVIATEPLGRERMEALMRENVAVNDVNFVLDYFRRSEDHRLLFGGRVSYSGHDALNTARATRRQMLKVFPQLADAKVEYAWGGYVDITMNRAPDFGRLASNIYYLQGFSGHGVALASMAGKLVAESIAGQAERFDLFRQIEHHNFPGGPMLRMPGLVLAMLWYRLKDLL